MSAPANTLALIVERPRLRRFAVLWRDEETAKPRSLVVCAQTVEAASDILLEALGHTNFELMEI